MTAGTSVVSSKHPSSHLSWEGGWGKAPCVYSMIIFEGF